MRTQRFSSSNQFWIMWIGLVSCSNAPSFNLRKCFPSAKMSLDWNPEGVEWLTYLPSNSTWGLPAVSVWPCVLMATTMVLPLLR